MNPPIELAAWLGSLAFLVMLVNGGLKLVDRLKDKPTGIEVRSELVDRFTTKQEFERLATHNTERHGQLFNSIERVEREARKEMETRFTDLNEERRAELEKLNEQFTFIRESIAAINRELQIRHHK